MTEIEEKRVRIAINYLSSANDSSLSVMKNLAKGVAAASQSPDEWVAAQMQKGNDVVDVDSPVTIEEADAARISAKHYKKKILENRVAIRQLSRKIPDIELTDEEAAAIIAEINAAES